jgi:hypothetical protein
MMLAILVGTIAGSSLLTGGNTGGTTTALGAALVVYAIAEAADKSVLPHEDRLAAEEERRRLHRITSRASGQEFTGEHAPRAEAPSRQTGR